MISIPLPLTTDTIIQATRRLWEKGVTLYYPTVITNGDEEIEEFFAGYRRGLPGG